MANTFRLSIITPFGRYLEGDAEFLEVRNDTYSMGILPNHAPLISTVSIGKVRIRTSAGEYLYACGGGVIEVEKEKVTLILNSIERSDEIAIERAKAAKERAQNRLDQMLDASIDVARAKAALLRAAVRIEVSESK